MEKELFEKLVQEGIEQIPEKFQKLLENVDIVIEDWPNQIQLRKTNLSPNSLLFGLYEGVPKTKRGTYYANVLPDKITIFQKSMEQISQEPEEIRKMVRRTVWHEIAHHFGLNEKQVREREKEKFK